MKPFNLEEAKAGKPLVTRDGRDAKFIAYVAECDRAYCVLCHVDGDTFVGSYTDDGKRFADETKSCADLFMKTTRKTIYVDLYPNGEWIYHINGVNSSTRAFAIGVPVEIEE